ncbi:arylsulfatase A family protein [Galbibacter orientalis DSM 19592]|uniref:Arylsulfatase A family protein n=1 Tax=Galbibacter orientalis DSM 19592 TaxID=926559 RepID=I3C4J3_9FLAO|nr:sulfatase [Galbibacter orientalis]EIJ38536.1 arylsulfatase A family protein [Galbibacter orientalis DSM 19592]
MKLTTWLLMVFFLIINTQLFSQDKMNVIIFIADDVSWNDLGCYGNTDVQSPTIDTLAEQGLKFNNFYLTASSCSPSRNSIITGRYPHNTGAAELHTEPPLWMKSFPEILKQNGYYTVQAGKFHMGAYAYRGFDKVFEKREENGSGGEKMWVDAIKERPKNKPFFMWFASYDAHREWGENKFSGTHPPNKITPPFYLVNGENTKEDMGHYYDEIKRFDYSIGEVLKELKNQGEMENTLLIVMADNGRPFPHSKTRVNDRGMKSPFIIYGPKNIVAKNTESNALVSAIDIAPTILDLANVSIEDQFQGVSFKEVLKSPSKSFRKHVFAEHNWHDYEAFERMVRTEDFMYIFNAQPQYPQSGPADAVGSPSYIDLEMKKEAGELTAAQADVFVTPRPSEELFNCKTDTLQLLNIASIPSKKEKLNELRTVLEKWMTETGDYVPEQLTKDWYTREAGYVKTESFEIRGEMPGSKTNAVKNNSKGAF